jgi:hypothetical protein
MEKIEAAGASFRSLTEAIDTTTAAGRMMMQMVGSFAEFERAMIRERTKAGLDQARAEGASAVVGPSLTPSSAPRLPTASCRVASPLRKWRVSIMSASPPCRGLWPRIGWAKRHNHRQKIGQSSGSSDAVLLR